MKTLREMQGSLYARAKTEKDAKFNTLMDKICRIDVLKEALNLVYANRGSPGIDGESVKQVKDREEEFLKELQEELINRTYRVESVKRVFIPKANGKQRPLGIPTVKDRIVQQAVKLIIEPIFEADFKNSSYGYRPNRNAKQASEEIRKYLNYGCTQIVDMDISSFFDNIDHSIMISLVEKRIRDSYVLHLIREWLRAGVVYKGETTYPTLGTPQGGVISPLLANIYLNEIDRFWEEEGRYTAKKYNAHLIRWADDMVILAGSNPKAIMAIMRNLLKKLKLSLNEEKSRITTAKEGFDFIGFHFFRRYITRKGKDVVIFQPSKKAVKNFREKAKQVLNRKNLAISEEEAVKRLNYLITGWTNYFNHTNASRIYNILQRFIDWIFYKFVAYRHKKRLAGRFMIVTDTDLPIGDIVKGYKDLWRIERSFRTIKSFLEIRPVNHRKEERIEAHVFVCVLSLLIARLFEKSMNNGMTVSVISDMLSELKAIPVRTADGIITLRSESENARKIPYPGKILTSVPT